MRSANFWKSAALSLALLLVASWGAVSHAQGRGAVESDRLIAALDQMVPTALQQHDVPSAAVAYVDETGLSFARVYGERAPGEAATEDTLYNIASMAKPLVAETALALASRGDLSLDEPMATWWIDPDIADDRRTALLTPLVALRHRTGFPNWRYETDDKLVFRADPDTRFGYSGEGFQYLAKYLEARTKVPLEALVEKTVFAPAGMHETAFTRRPWFDGRLASPKGPDGAWDKPQVREKWNAADDVFATVGDYGRFLAWAMAPERLKPSLEQMRMQVTDDQAGALCASGRLPEGRCPDALGFGLGWTIMKANGDTFLFHGGADRGERTLGIYSLNRRRGVVIFTNGANGQKVIRDVVRLLLPDPTLEAFMTMQAGG